MSEEEKGFATVKTKTKKKNEEMLEVEGFLFLNTISFKRKKVWMKSEKVHINKELERKT